MDGLWFIHYVGNSVGKYVKYLNEARTQCEIYARIKSTSVSICMSFRVLIV